jgi:putative mRNA 3-end processing factor
MKLLEGRLRFCVHPTIDVLNKAYASSGLHLPEAELYRSGASFNESTLFLAPPGALRSLRFAQKAEPSIAMASGWMAIRGMRRRSGFDQGFVLSDHADWEGLNRAVTLSGAERIDATHGYSDIFARYWREQGKDARVLKTDYEGGGE